MAMLPNPLPGLADDPTGRSLGLRLPHGSVFGTPDEPSLLWYAKQPAAPDSWAGLLPARMTAGLQPVLLGVAELPPEKWDLDPGLMSYPGDHDPEDVLAEFWEYSTENTGAEAEPGNEAEGDTEDGYGFLAPFGPDWPGPAPAREPAADPDDRAAEVVAGLVARRCSEDFRPALVHARRSADIPAAIGWTGPVSHDEDVAPLCAVLRSWEDRFGIRVVALTRWELLLSVAAPPMTRADAEAVAAEHFALCPGILPEGGEETLGEYAGRVVLGKAFWRFGGDRRSAAQS